jgi:CheY-like chemotaxis protein
MNLEFKTGESVAGAILQGPAPLNERSQPPRRARLRSSETILVVEDQRVIRQHMVSCLEGLGYNVLPFPDPESALASLGQFKGRIDLLLTNFSMRGMAGHELLRRAGAERPDLKALYMSSQPEELVWESAFLQQKPAWLAKPFTPQLLASGVRKALGWRHRVILVVDEDREVRAFLTDALGGNSYEVLEAADLNAARGILKTNRVDLMIGDVTRFEQKGEESIRNLRRLHPATGILVMTGNLPAVSKNPPFVRRRTRHRIEKDDLKARWLLGAHATLPKPISADLLRETVDKALAR